MAVNEDKTITIKYQKYDGTVSTRKVSDLEYTDEYGNYDEYIHGFCHLRNEYRTFKISRIIEVDGIKSSSIHSSSTKNTYTNSASSSSSLGTSPNIRTHSTLSSRTYYDQKSSMTYSSPSQRNEGCYIATMAYGDYDHPQVLILRNFRDKKLMTTFLGKHFVKFYYTTSPKLVKKLKGHHNINLFIRTSLDLIIRIFLT